MFRFCKDILGVSIRFSLSYSRHKKSSDIFIAYIKKKIAAMECSSYLYKGNAYARNSIANYKKILRLWPDFEEFIGCDGIRISEISMETYSRFMEFCDSRRYMDSTKYQYMTLIKAVMNSALEEGVSDNNIQNSKGFVTHRASSVFKKVYLTEDEISGLAALDLTESPSSLQKVRDVFLIGCWTGQRFSDYSGISMDEMEEITIDGIAYKALRMIQKKTDRTVIVPVLDKRLLDIIEHWGGRTPKVSVSVMNSKIKQLCRMAGIDALTTVYCRKGGVKIKVSKPKYELVSSHTARRSFITNLYLGGKLSTGQIRSISGHSSEESFKRYLCQSNEDEIKGIIKNVIGV